MHLSRLLFISRPRFWLYLFGPFLLGYTSGIQSLSEFSSWSFLLFALFFLFPANLFIYGINDIHDYETDVLNEKKQKKEALVLKQEHTVLTILLWVIILLGVLLTLILATPQSALAVTAGYIGFIFFGGLYSSPPIRAKAIPLLDSFFNILYIMPALIGYGLAHAGFPNLQLFIATGLWCMAMHAYSAIPDISVDRKAGISTVATFLKKKGTLIFCIVCYLSSALLSIQYLEATLFLGGIYCTMMVISMFAKSKELEGLYWSFPYINMLSGMILWALIVYQKFF